MGSDAGPVIAPRCLIRRWRDLDSWITAGDIAGWSSSFDTVLMRDLVSRRSEQLALADSFGDANPVTVHLTGEVSVRDRAIPYKGAVFAAYPGDIILSKIDARNGAIGVVPDNIGKVAVTPEFPVFTPHPGAVNGDYIRFLIRTGHFLDALKVRSSGTSGRKRITADTFLSLAIPLPNLSVQEELVARFFVQCQKADSRQRLAGVIEEQAIRGFEDALGFAASLPETKGDLGIARFAELDRWSHDWVIHSRLATKRGRLKIPVSDLRSLAEVQHGLAKSPRNRPSANSRDYLRVANVQRWYVDLSDVKSIDVPDDDLPKYRLRPGDVLVCEGGALDQVGRSAVWNGEIDDCVHQNHIFRVRVDTSVVLPGYVAAVLNSNYGRRYFRMKAKRTTIASINGNDLAFFPLPVPPIEMQDELASRLEKQRAKASDVRRTSINIRQQAWDDFIDSIYK